MAVAYVGLGSNLGDREALVFQAIAMLGALSQTNVVRRAGIYETEPVGRQDQPWFVNTVVQIETTLGPETLLTQTQEIETRLGRQRQAHWGPREIDLDILLYGDRVMNTSQLTLPHPELHRRRFVLVPLCELAPDLIHPVLKRPLRELLSALPETKQVTLLITKKS
jgi:2-amino-4-hydroxy-6-hydroxymethyldihydropteridine diphosphokinase